jgi:hypothetical protein
MFDKQSEKTINNYNTIWKLFYYVSNYIDFLLYMSMVFFKLAQT